MNGRSKAMTLVLSAVLLQGLAGVAVLLPRTLQAKRT